MATTSATTSIERPPFPISIPPQAKWTRIGIWVSTGLFSTMFAASGVMFLVGTPEAVTAFRHLGYPDYFRHMLGIAKLFGVAALVLPAPGAVLREWAYAGFVFTCLAASASHLMSGDPAGKVLGPLLALGMLMTSYLLRRRARPGVKSA